MSKININEGWNYLDKKVGGQHINVDLPHCPMIEGINVYKPYVTKMQYIKDIVIEDYARDKQYFLEFEGAMINAAVYIDNKLVVKHYGGYLPFIVPITDAVRRNGGKANCRVELCNKDDKYTPPGKPTGVLDFLYYGGIYRNVNLISTASVYMTHPLELDERRGGATIITTMGKAGWNIAVTAVIANKSSENSNVEVVARVMDGDRVITDMTATAMLHSGDCSSIYLSSDDINAASWSIDSPHLHNLSLSIYNGSELVDRHDIEFGFREATVDSGGFKLNGEVVKLFGVNRHHQFPYLGIAVSDEMNRREARLLKDAGNNCLRLAHYPQSPAFLSECDKLGMVVIDCVPGWQFIGGRKWKKRLQENTRDMVRRDSNHASVLIYEVTPNESRFVSRKGDEYIKGLAAIVKCNYAEGITCGDSAGRYDAEYVGLDIPFTGDDKRSAVRPLYGDMSRKFLRREYGDWGFGGNKSSSRCSRGDGELAMQVQAWNFQWTHNKHYVEENVLGDIIWEGIDHNRGYYPKEAISKSGVFDIFRLPKLSYGFLASQRKPLLARDYVIFPMVTNIAGKTKLPIYSNCHTLKLLINNSVVAERNCDSGATVPYNDKAKGHIPDDYWLSGGDHIATSNQYCHLAKHTISCLYDGGNCEGMSYPPFTFNNLTIKADDVVEIVGSDSDGNVRHKVTIREPLVAQKLDIVVADHNIKLVANNNDAVFVYVKAISKNYNIDTKFNSTVTLTVDGGTCVMTDKVMAEAGIASFMVKADKGATAMTLTASCEQLVHKVEYKL